MKPYINPGFIPDVHKEEDYVFGASSIPQEILCPDGDWRPYLPKLEVQRNNYFDTFSCVSFANCNILEMMHKKRYGEEINMSDRFMSVMSGTVAGRGNSHSVVAECARKKGYVKEEEYPFTPEMTQTQFFTYPPTNIQDIGIKWTLEDEYGYEKVRREDFKEALKYSPIQVAVDSRTNKTSNFQGADHSVVLVALDSKAHIFDSYLNRYEEYELNYPFSFGQRYHYKKILTLNLSDMALKFIRNKENGNIFLIDSDGKRHWIKEPDAFTGYFGNTAWANNDWINISSKEVEQYPESISISLKNSTLGEELIKLFNQFGKKIGIK